MALINDPREYDKYSGSSELIHVPQSNGSRQPHARQLTTLHNVVGGSPYCPECRQYIFNPTNNSTTSSSGHHASSSSSNESNVDPNTTTTPNIAIPSSEVIRDANYFKLLELFDQHHVPEVMEEAESVQSSGPTSRAQTPEVNASSSSAEASAPQQQQYSSISESAFSQGYFDRFFKVKQQLGKGSRGVVYLVEHILDGYSLGLFACKKVTVGNDHKWLEKVLSEVHFLRLLSHPNLVNYNHMWLESSRISMFAPVVPCAFILQEYCNGGTLEDYVHRLQSEALSSSSPVKSKKDAIRRRSQIQQQNFNTRELFLSALLTPTEILFFFRDIVRGVSHLHSHQVIHRDLKPSNCLLISGPDNNTDNNSSSSAPPRSKFPTVLVSDFGEGQMEGLLRSGTGTTGTLEYCAPELINPNILSRGGSKLAQFSKLTDIFSLGMIFHFLCFSRLPYSPRVVEGSAPEDVELLRKEVYDFKGFDYRNLPVREDLPNEVYTLLARMVSINPKERPLTEEIFDSLEVIITQMNLTQNGMNGTTRGSTAAAAGFSTHHPPSRASIRLLSNQSIEAARTMDKLTQDRRVHELDLGSVSEPVGDLQEFSKVRTESPTTSPSTSKLHSNLTSSSINSTKSFYSSLYFVWAIKCIVISIKLHSLLNPGFYINLIPTCFLSQPSDYQQYSDNYQYFDNHDNNNNINNQHHLEPLVSHVLCVLMGLDLSITSLYYSAWLLGIHFIGILGSAWSFNKV